LIVKYKGDGFIATIPIENGGCTDFALAGFYHHRRTGVGD
jgi:hypothetical protein